MMFEAFGIAVAISLAAPVAAQAQAAKPNDAQIAHIAYTAGQIDVAAGKQALAKSHDKQVRAFAEEMVRDHAAVNDQALALVKKLGVTPQDNPTSQSLSADAAAKLKRYASLNGKAFDRAYLQNEVAYHRTVNGALSSTLIPDARNSELKALLETGLKLFTEHQHHAEHLVQSQH
jgi:putative membrane protein